MVFLRVFGVDQALSAILWELARTDYPNGHEVPNAYFFVPTWFGTECILTHSMRSPFLISMQYRSRKLQKLQA